MNSDPSGLGRRPSLHPQRACRAEAGNTLMHPAFSLQTRPRQPTAWAGAGGTTRPSRRPHPTGALGDAGPRLHLHPSRRREPGLSLPGGRTPLPGAGDTERLAPPASPE